ncbi:unnamed protein product [Effrenium voratum]|nr:unnamed protein product [Effrenium voratum]
MASELAARLHARQGKPGTCPCRARACAHQSSQSITLPAYFAGLLSCQARFRWAGRVAQFLSVWDVHPAFQKLQIDIPSAWAAQPFLRRQVSTRLRLCSAALRSEPIQLDGPRGTRPSLCRRGRSLWGFSELVWLRGARLPRRSFSRFPSSGPEMT